MIWLECGALAAITSVTGCFLIIRALLPHAIGTDTSRKIQKLHDHTVLRLGGIPVFLGVTVAGIVYLVLHPHRSPAFFIQLWIVLLPGFLIGLADDFREGNLGVWCRLLTTMAAVGMGYWLLGARISRVDVGWIDTALLGSNSLMLALTLIAGAGIPHAINMIDGCNGLASFICILALCGIGVAASELHDTELRAVCFIGAGALLGFLVWNFPFGKLFLGDSGAYFAGLLIAETSMLLVNRHPQISAWFPFALVVYPVWEALYSSFRRARQDPRQIMHPDARHLHQLIFRRISRPLMAGTSEAHLILANSMSALPFWAISIAVTILSLRYRSEPFILLVICAAFAVTYVQSYIALAKTHLRVRRVRADDVPGAVLGAAVNREPAVNEMIDAQK